MWVIPLCLGEWGRRDAIIIAQWFCAAREFHRIGKIFVYDSTLAHMGKQKLLLLFGCWGSRTLILGR